MATERPGASDTRGQHPPAPEVRLGTVTQGGLAPAILAVIERGVSRRPAIAASIDAEIELSTRHEYPPVRIVLDRRTALVEDGPAARPDLRITGSLPDLVGLMVAPLVRGVPNPLQARGRAALGMVALRRVRVEGRVRLMRQFLNLIRI